MQAVTTLFRPLPQKINWILLHSHYTPKVSRTGSSQFSSVQLSRVSAMWTRPLNRGSDYFVRLKHVQLFVVCRRRSETSPTDRSYLLSRHRHELAWQHQAAASSADDLFSSSVEHTLAGSAYVADDAFLGSVHIITHLISLHITASQPTSARSNRVCCDRLSYGVWVRWFCCVCFCLLSTSRVEIMAEKSVSENMTCLVSSWTLNLN